MSQLQLKKLHFEPFKLQSGYIVEMLQQQLVDGSTNSRKRERGKASHIGHKRQAANLNWNVAELIYTCRFIIVSSYRDVT